MLLLRCAFRIDGLSFEQEKDEVSGGITIEQKQSADNSTTKRN